MNISYLQDVFSKHKKTAFYVILWFLFFFLNSDFAFANPENNGNAWTDFFNLIVSFFNFFVFIFTILSWIINFLVSLFLSPDWVNGSIFGLQEKMREIWILVSNIVYFIFAFVLIWIAFMNIIGRWGDKYQLKQTLPKFIVWVLIVPFSWFIVQFMLSISAILTAAVLTLPADTFNDYNVDLEKIKIPTGCTINMWNFWGDNLQQDQVLNNQQAAEQFKEVFNCDTSEKQTIDDYLSQNIYGIIAVYSYAVMNVDKYDTVKDINVKGGLQNVLKLVEKGLFDILFIAIYFILIIALALALIVRWIFLWIYVMISPVFGLLYFFDKADGAGEWIISKFSIKEFIALALVPVYVSAALSFGLLFLVVIWKGFASDNISSAIWNDPNTSIISNLKSPAKLEDGTSLKGDERAIRINAFWMKLDFVWSDAFLSSTWSLWWVIEWGKDIWSQSGAAGLGFIGDLIMRVFGLVILWGAVIAALRTSKITHDVIKPIEQFGNQVWSLVAKSPQYIPVFGGQSAQSLQRVAWSVQSHFDTKASNRAGKLLEDTPFGDSSKVVSELKWIRTWLMNGSLGDAPSKVEALRKTMSLAGWDTKKLYNDKEYQETLFDLARKILPADKLKSIAEKPSDINSLTKLTELISAIDGIPGYYWVYEGSTKLWTSEEDKLVDLVKSLGEWEAKVAAETGTLTQPSVKVLSDTSAVINIWWNDKLAQEFKDGKITKLWDDLAPLVAQYISQSWFDEEGFDEWKKQMNFWSVDSELNEYFYVNKEGDILFNNEPSSDDSKSSLSQFLKSNNPT